MEERILSPEKIESFICFLADEERSENTKQKYLRDIKVFSAFAGKIPINRNTVIAYKKSLIENGYRVRSINSMLAALNSLWNYLGWHELRVKTMKLQKEVFRSEEKELTREEYVRLCNTALRKNNIRMNLVLQTICSTGMRVSELRFITAEAVRQGEAAVSMKGKTRVIFIVKDLRAKLLRYMCENNITSGCVFVTKGGKQLNRTSIWREMKQLCEDADVNPDKVFPHNLRHLFARVFYAIEKDIAKLADILGHSSIETTRIYIISTGSEHRRRMENMHLIM